jgi:hypothetical protein
MTVPMGLRTMAGMKVPPFRPVILSAGVLTGLQFIQKYRFLTIAQFAKAAGLSTDRSAVVLRHLERRQFRGFFGFVSLPGQGRTPKVYFLKRKGWELILAESGITEDELGAFSDVHQEATWTPQMYHRLRLLDLLIALEVQVLATSAPFLTPRPP